MKRFIVVDWEMLKCGLSPLEVLLYAFIRPYSDKGIGYETKYAELANFFSVTEGQLKYAIKHLKEDGFLIIKRRQYDVVLTAVQKSKNEQSEKSKNEQSETPQKSKLTLSEIKNQQVSHITNNNKSNREDNNNIIPPFQKDKNRISESDTQPDREETIEPEAVNAEADTSSIEQRRYEIILRLIADQYTERGDIYIPNYATQTTVALSLVRKVETLMQHYNVADTDDQFADVWRRFLTAGYESGDQFQRDHWTLDYIDKQFMAIFNKLNSENNGKQQGTNRSGKGNARISADYVQKTMREAGLTI